MMDSRILTLLVIIVLTGIGMMIRAIAFERADSYAVEVSKTSFGVNLVMAICASKSVAEYCDNYLIRSLLLLGITLATVGIHRAFKTICIGSIHEKIDSSRKRIRDLTKSDESLERQIIIDKADNQLISVETIANKSLYLCYSRHLDDLSGKNDFLRNFMGKFNGGKGAYKGYRRRKTELREDLATLANLALENALQAGGGLPEQYESYNGKFDEADFNINIHQQKIGLLCFQVLPTLAALIGANII